MGKDTDIQWSDSTVNPTTGCDGCELWDVIKKGPCYAGNYHETRMARSLPKLYAPDFTEVRMIPGRMAKAAAWSDLTGTDRPEKPWLDGRPRVIFVEDMGDLFSRAVTFDFLKAELIDVALSPKGARHIWMVLTKRPGRLGKFATWLRATFGLVWPENIWVGTSVTNAATLKRVDKLMMVPASTRFLSVEPLIESIPLAPWFSQEFWDMGEPGDCPAFRLVIVGGESDQPGHDARPFEVDWGIELLADSDVPGVSFFWKQMGSNLIDSHGERIKLRDSHGGDWDEWPLHLRVREFPQVAAPAAHDLF